MTNKKVWIDTPGLKDVLENEVPLARKLLVDGDYPILVRGAPRTGKSHIRDEIGNTPKLQKIKEGVINCAAIPTELVESILFGHKKGSFTGAGTDSPGLLLDNSDPPKIVFLEEIGELPKHIQAKLLVFFDDGSFMPVGAKWGEGENSTLRIIATSNADDDKFRPDFLSRFWEISVPSIYERREDIPHFLNHFLEGDEQKLSADELFFLMTHNWPGEVTEIKKVCIQIAHHYFPKKISRGFGFYVSNLISKSTPLHDTWYPYVDFCQKLVLHEKDDIIKQLFPHFCLGTFGDDPALIYELCDLATEWNAWCYFFGLDSKSPFNINTNFKKSVAKHISKILLFPQAESACNIDERYAFDPQLKYFVDFLKSRKLWNDEGMSLLNNLRHRAIEHFYYWYYPFKKDENQKESKELVSLEQTSYKQYRSLFWEHQAKLGRTGRQVAERYNDIKIKTAEDNIRKNKILLNQK
jgi:hypothetical protein